MTNDQKPKTKTIEKDSNPKKILVTGGAGFIGGNFILYMMDKYPNYKIVNLDKLTYAGNLETLKQVENNPNYQFIQGDICDRKIVDKAMEDIDIVVHFAAESHVDKSIAGPAIFVQTNVVGTQVLLDVAKDKKIDRFHHVSTDEVFGALPLDKPEQKFHERLAYNPHSPYSASKAGSDHLVRAYHDTYGMDITISNCSNNYGPYQFPEKIIPLFITNAMQNKPLPIYGKGLAVRDYIYVTDHCKGIDLIVHKGRSGETYCIGGHSEKNGLEVSDTILEATGKSLDLKTYVEDRKGHDMRYAIDDSKIQRELGYQPSVTFKQGIEQTIEWYVANKEWWERIISKEYLDINRATANRRKSVIGREIGNPQKPNEPDIETERKAPHYDVGIVLGTGFRQESNDFGNKLSFDSKIRTLAAGILASKGIIDQLILTGGHTAGKGSPSEAEIMKKYLILKFKELESFPIILENEAIDTIENSSKVAEILRGQDSKLFSKDIVLITNGYHMLRAKRNFGNQRVKLEGIPAQDIVSKKSDNHEKIIADYLKSCDVTKKKTLEAFLYGLTPLDPEGKLLTAFAKIIRQKD